MAKFMGLCVCGGAVLRVDREGEVTAWRKPEGAPGPACIADNLLLAVELLKGGVLI